METIELPTAWSVRVPLAAQAPGLTRIVPVMREVVVSDVWSRSIRSWYGPGARRISRRAPGRSGTGLGVGGSVGATVGEEAVVGVQPRAISPTATRGSVVAHGRRAYDGFGVGHGSGGARAGKSRAATARMAGRSGSRDDP